ncbi:dentin sialophosphoprotein-like [Daktulosphaira vitifoliae]|uniref:dentin sialophosphoprotein-like n=1 Tax=Daktulosphaira vitifoliae TaxID=58002 RepID=UPI0021AA7469|nr:dentin sialophosphoprotein-like [Daktulosphaira vitifoliae]
MNWKTQKLFAKLKRLHGKPKIPFKKQTPVNKNKSLIDNPNIESISKITAKDKSKRSHRKSTRSNAAPVTEEDSEPFVKEIKNIDQSRSSYWRDPYEILAEQFSTHIDKSSTKRKIEHDDEKYVVERQKSYENMDKHPSTSDKSSELYNSSHSLKRANTFDGYELSKKCRYSSCVEFHSSKYGPQNRVVLKIRATSSTSDSDDKSKITNDSETDCHHGNGHSSNKARPTKALDTCKSSKKLEYSSNVEIYVAQSDELKDKIILNISKINYSDDDDSSSSSDFSSHSDSNDSEHE